MEASAGRSAAGRRPGDLPFSRVQFLTVLGVAFSVTMVSVICRDTPALEVLLLLYGITVLGILGHAARPETRPYDEKSDT